MLNIIYGRVRSGKTYLLTQSLIETLRSGNGDVVLIVPEQYSFQSEKDILEKIGSEYAARVRTLSFTRLMDEVGRECGGIAGKRINSGIRTIMISRAMNTVADSLTIFAKQAGNTKFASSVASAVAEMKQAAILPQRLLEVSQSMEDCRLKWKLHDLGLIMSAYDALTAHLFIDPADDMNRLARMLEGNRWFKDKHIFIDCFSGFTSGEFAVLENIIATAASVTVTLPCESAVDEDEGAGLFSNVSLTARRILDIAKAHGVEINEVNAGESRYDYSELKVLEKELFSFESAEAQAKGDRVRVFCGDYPTDEAAYAAATIKRLVREEGYRYRDFAVVARKADTYLRAVKNAMECYEVPVHTDSNESARDQAVSVFALSAIKAAFTFDTEEIMRWLKTGIAGYGDYETALLENYTFTWGINGKEWKDEWHKSPDGLTNRKSKDADSRLAQLETMRRDIVSKLSRFAKAFSGNATDMAKALYRLSEECAVSDNLSRKYSEIFAYDKNAAQVLRQSYGVFMAVLSDIAECYRDAQIDKETFITAFKAALNEYEIGTIPMGLDEVVFGSADRVIMGSPKIVFILGMNQNVFPAAVGGDGLISVRDRRAMIDMELPVSDRLFDSAVNEKFLFYSSACRASERVYFTYSKYNMSSEAIEISPYLLRINELFPESESAAESPLERIQSKASAKNVFADIYGENDAFSSSVKRYFATDGETDTALKSYLADASDSELSKDAAWALFGKNIHLSATRVDRFFGCPFSYFCKFGINAKPLEKSEMNALQRGSLAHYILEHILKEFGKGLSSMDETEIGQAIDRYVEEYIREIEADQLVDYRWQVMLKQVKELCIVLCGEMGSQLADTDFEPVGFEVTLEKGGIIEPVELDTGDGGKVILGGQVDRVDALKKGDENYVCVVDYKTGRKKFHLPDLLWGLNMQMLLYLYSAVKGGKYEGGVPAGVLYIPSERSIKDNSPKTDAYSGILLNDTDILTALDNSRSGRFIPVKYKKDGALSDAASQITFTEEEFGLLFNNAEAKLIEMGQRLHKGNVSADPLDGADTYADACKYCDYRAVCLREKDTVNRKVEKLKKEEIISVLRGESNGND